MLAFDENCEPLVLGYDGLTSPSHAAPNGFRFSGLADDTFDDMGFSTVPAEPGWTVVRLGHDENPKPYTAQVVAWLVCHSDDDYDVSVRSKAVVVGPWGPEQVELVDGKPVALYYREALVCGEEPPNE